jgi:hypothetical protein
LLAGLPQYRDAFAEHLIDGAMLVALNVEDLCTMKITSAVHMATLATGIRLLNAVHFNLNRMTRKYSPVSFFLIPLKSKINFIFLQIFIQI